MKTVSFAGADPSPAVAGEAAGAPPLKSPAASRGTRSRPPVTSPQRPVTSPDPAHRLRDIRHTVTGRHYFCRCEVTASNGVLNATKEKWSAFNTASLFPQPLRVFLTITEIPLFQSARMSRDGDRGGGGRRGGGPPPDTSRMVSLKVDGLSHRYGCSMRTGESLEK